MSFRFLLVFVLLSFTANAQFPHISDYDTMGMAERKAKHIKSELTLREQYDRKKKKFVPCAQDTSYYRLCDREGRLLRTCYESENDRGFSWYRYDANGQIAERFLGDDSLNGFVRVYTYDHNAQLVAEESHTVANGQRQSLRLTRYTWGPNGCGATEQEYYTSSDELRSSYITTYITNASCQVMDMYYISADAPDTLFHTHYTHYPSGDTREMISYDKRSSTGEWYVSAKWEFLVDTTGNVITQTFHHWDYDAAKDALVEDRPPSIYTYTLDGKVLSGNDGEKITKYFYSDNGELQYRIEYDLDGKPLFRYTEIITYY